jgi:hypothetical protein
MHAYSELFAEKAGMPKRQVVHDLVMLVLKKRIRGDEPESEIYARYERLRESFSAIVDE